MNTLMEGNIMTIEQLIAELQQRREKIVESFLPTDKLNEWKELGRTINIIKQSKNITEPMPVTKRINKTGVNRQKVRDFLLENPNSTVPEISRGSGVGKTSIPNILTNEEFERSPDDRLRWRLTQAKTSGEVAYESNGLPH